MVDLAPLVVLLPGIRHELKSWSVCEAFIPRYLADVDVHVVRYASTSASFAAIAERVVADVEALVQPRQRVHLVGVSLGGVVAMLVAHRLVLASVTTIGAPMRGSLWCRLATRVLSPTLLAWLLPPTLRELGAREWRTPALVAELDYHFVVGGLVADPHVFSHEAYPAALTERCAVHRHWSCYHALDGANPMTGRLLRRICV